jgi:hypothetical protein
LTDVDGWAENALANAENGAPNAEVVTVGGILRLALENDDDDGINDGCKVENEDVEGTNGGAFAFSTCGVNAEEANADVIPLHVLFYKVELKYSTHRILSSFPNEMLYNK